MIPASALSFIPQTETPRREPFALLPFSIIQALSGNVTRSGILVYCALATHADPQGHCWPGRARLAEITELNERQVSRATAELEKKGLLRKEHCLGGRVDYWLLPVPSRTPPPVTDDTPPLSPLSPRTDQGTIQKEQREPVSPETPPEPAEPDVPPSGALSDSATRPHPEPAPKPAPHPRPAGKAPVVPFNGKTQLPNDWQLPVEWREWAEQQRPELADRLDAIAGNFRDYHESKGTRSASWIAEWRRWINRERAPKPPTRPVNAAQTTSPYPRPGTPEKPVSAAVRASWENSERERVALLIREGIDPATGLRIGPPAAPPPTGPLPLPDGSRLVSGAKETPEQYAKRFEEHRQYQLRRLQELIDSRAKKEGER